jgi:hypothetical protein
MKLSHDQQKHVAQHLNMRSTSPKCTVCGASNLRVRKNVLRLPFEAPDPATGADHRLAVCVDCSYCGHVMYFAPDALGLELDAPSAASHSDGTE